MDEGATVLHHWLWIHGIRLNAHTVGQDSFSLRILWRRNWIDVLRQLFPRV